MAAMHTLSRSGQYHSLTTSGGGAGPGAWEAMFDRIPVTKPLQATQPAPLMAKSLPLCTSVNAHACGALCQPHLMALSHLDNVEQVDKNHSQHCSLQSMQGATCERSNT